MTHEVSSRLSTVCSGDFKICPFYTICVRLLGHQKLFKGTVMQMDMFQEDPANPGQTVRYRVLARAEEMAHLGCISKNRIMIEAVCCRMREVHQLQDIVLGTKMFLHGIQQLIHLVCKIEIRLLPNQLDHGIQLVDDAPVTTVAARIQRGTRLWSNHTHIRGAIVSEFHNRLSLNYSYQTARIPSYIA